jgi:hypothetical protein
VIHFFAFFQPALCGDGRTMMIVTLSPTQEAFDNSLTALQFGESVNKVGKEKEKRALQIKKLFHCLFSVYGLSSSSSS